MITLYIGRSFNTSAGDTGILDDSMLEQACKAASIQDYTYSQAIGVTEVWNKEPSWVVAVTEVYKEQVAALCKHLRQSAILVSVPGREPKLVFADGKVTPLPIHTDI